MAAPAAAAPTRPQDSPGDFLGLDDSLTEQERLLRDTVRRFVHDRVLPHIGDWVEAGVFPRDLIKELGRLGVLAMHVQGASAVDYGLPCLEAQAGICAHPMGPLALVDLIGLDTSAAVAASLYEEFKEPLYAAPPMLSRMVEAGLLGRKAKRGFYDYS